MLVLLLVLPGSLFSVMNFQAGSTIRLATPVARAPDSFVEIASVRELKDGQVIVLDRRQLTIQVLDLVAQRSRSLGRTGEGPGEYRAPLKLVPLLGDSTALIDGMAGSRLLIITPDAQVNGGLSLPRVDALSYPDWSDRTGRLYSTVHRVAAKGRSGDSAWIVRWDGTGRLDTVAAISVTVNSAATPSLLPFAARDEWAVAPDGRVAVVSPKHFRVTFFGGTGGQQRVGPALEDDLVQVSEDDKREWRKKAQEPALALTSSRGGPVILTWLRLPYREPSGWPNYLPPLRSGGVKFAPDGLLWLERATRFGARPVVDVIDENGKAIRRIQLPSGTRLVGFGLRSVYLARSDQDNLEWLEKYQLPMFGPSVHRIHSPRR